MTATFVATVTDFSPVLPDALFLSWAGPSSWGMVMAYVAFSTSRRFGQRTRLWVSAAVLAWAWAPGAWSPAYWLGLAFQVPSWMTVLLCVTYLFQRLKLPSSLGQLQGANPAGWQTSTLAVGMAISGILLGWALLLDAFVMLPFYAYQWGFGFGALAVAVVFAAGLSCVQLVRDSKATAFAHPAYLLVAALVLFVLTRLPTGNVFDALIDPWLWFWLQASLVRGVIRRRRQKAATTLG